MFQATRRRLALWYTAITAVLLLLFASGVYLYVRSTLIERVDDTLNHVVEIIQRSLVISPVHGDAEQFQINVEASFRNNASTVDDDHIDLEWFSPNGKLLWSTLSEPLNIPIHGNHLGETVRVVKQERLEDGEKLDSPLSTEYSPILLRQVTQRVEVGRQVLGYLRVSHPWFEVTKPSRQLIIDLALGIWFMVLSVAASGWFLSGKAMEPVDESYHRLKQFTADASHELRSPITLIQTNVQVALADLELAETEATAFANYRQQLKVVERLTQRLGKLVDDLLFLARQDSGISKDIFSSCSLDALLMEVVEEQQLLAKEKKITLTLDLVDPPVGEALPQFLDNWFTLQGKWDQLVRLFTNLISNALQYTPSPGEVHIQLARLEGSSRVSKIRSSTALLQIKVSDTGIGIPAEALPRLFDRFYRVDPARTHKTAKTTTESSTGSGLGLAIAAAIVEHHQGQLHVESNIGKGTTFTITLPITLEF
ncbi:sensor histidine kinase [Umezakia ovalisporum]|jgi:OmpR-family two-component system manganese-sensing sensor histidine kinase|uniref:histidine kinase n=1 Tax=Umezakia ovalisporum FSS-43 TaxID=2740520 RepID=A0ABT6K3L1_9CYAN|nr:HAMP domain-containing sensor histidine kinase [Umezakia ovalisporum]MBI1240033.1 sensor histidine kinase [Nostoc sp. RI_552]MDH6056944.1 HAMP domain-containing histidine kinase [Umezakia ovalisporum FSS-43]MDH6068394.1 HAMP domain-containing histidine kinase [Umezakia ovalisporum APH033B]MDH6071135.1 HAMP domain-containing histidine kinase [Umezakia ovalisporum CobakiLakeA]MDH6074840.1 HAMP domain-containing histidine kinase [Umezakia ovalisporum CS-1034]